MHPSKRIQEPSDDDDDDEVDTMEQKPLPMTSPTEQQQEAVNERKNLLQETSIINTKELSDAMGNDSNHLSSGSNNSFSSFSATEDPLVCTDTETSNQTSLYTPYKTLSITTSCFTSWRMKMQGLLP